MGLDERAIEAVKQWIFKPAYKDQKLVETPMPVSVPVEFRL
jgi:TonB family protein